ncbi:MAG: hypothetical protein JW839_08605 [Candidatus Lokiarchaeota archaeon]|nr:hypothetical protein [Candidatus Lokiarchaeota archaeon]
MNKDTSSKVLSFSMISVGVMLTLTFGFVPTLNILRETGFGEIYALLFWFPFGGSCLIAGSIVDKVKDRSFCCFFFVAWGGTALCLNLTTSDYVATLSLISAIAVITGFCVSFSTAYIASTIPVNRRGYAVGWRLGIGWLLVAVTALVSGISTYANVTALGIVEIALGVVLFVDLKARRKDTAWKQLVNVPKDFSVSKNAFIFYTSSVVFGLFLGIVVFIMGTEMRRGELGTSIYLRNIEGVFLLAESAGLYIVNFDFAAVGLFCAVVSPMFGKLTDKIGRKHIYFFANVLLPTTLMLFPFMDFFVVSFVNVLFYSLICSIYMIIDSTVWADLAPEEEMARFTGIGLSALGMGGGLGYVVAWGMTLPQAIPVLDLTVMMIIVLLLVSSFIPFYFMKESLPPSEEMGWARTIHDLYVISDGGIIMNAYSFLSNSSVDPTLFSGGISGVATILKEMTGSEQKLQIIDHEDKKILFEYGKRFTVTLVAEKDLKILRTKLKALARDIHNAFWEIIGSWNADLSVFKPVTTMIKNHFLERDGA